MHELLEQLFELKTQWLQIAKTISNETGKDERTILRQFYRYEAGSSKPGFEMIELLQKYLPRFGSEL